MTVPGLSYNHRSDYMKNYTETNEMFDLIVSNITNNHIVFRKNKRNCSFDR